MNKTFFTKLSNTISVGFAMFAMMFGAGNVIYPLALGRDTGDKLWFGLAGFCITAVIIPLIGLIAVMLCDGKYENFLGKLGRIPGFITGLICMMLLGPLVFTPRCITISHASVSAYFPEFSLFLYSIFVAALIFACTIRPTSILDLLGKVLGPIKFLLLFTAIIAGFFFPQAFMDIPITNFKGFHTGIMAGYWTGDLLATIFFSGLIYAGLKKNMSGNTNYRQLAIMGLQAGSIGALLLAFVYGGFCIVAGFNGQALQGIPDGNIFSFLIPFLLGPIGGLLANITVALATITTAIALTAVSASFFQQYVFCNRLSYKYALILTIATTTMISNLGFAGIMKFAGPIIFTIYPALIMLAVASSLQVLFGFRWVKTPVYAIFFLTIITNYGEDIKQSICKKTTAEKVYDILDKHRITYDIDARSVDATTATTPAPITGKAECIEQLNAFVREDKPIRMIAVGFPFKSPNHEKKTIGNLPDMAERKSFEYLQNMLNEIKARYTPGAQLIIFCDGMPFAEFLGVTQKNVVAYEQALHNLVADLPDITLISSTKLMHQHNLETLDDINVMIDGYRQDDALKAQQSPTFAIACKRFAVEFDYAAGKSMLKKKSIEERVCGILTRETCLRAYISKHFPRKEYFRLTAHLSTDISKKFGIKYSPDSEVTPYHGACVIEDDDSWKIYFKKDIDPTKYMLTTKEINGISCFYYKPLKGLKAKRG